MALRKGIRGARGPAAMGICPVCFTRQRVLNASGKIGLHGRSEQAPDGCAGSYARPHRPGREAGAAGTVVGFRPGDDGPAAQ